MSQRQIPGKAYAITHIHTDASIAEASELDPRISRAINRIPGAVGKIGWAECFTSVDRLTRMLLDRRGGNGPVHIITLTDHMRRRSHHIPRRHMAAASKDLGLSIGAEIFTHTRDIDGAYHKGPEILAYGGAELVEGPYGPYHGLSQDFLDELYDTCLDDQGEELDTRRAARLMRMRGIAHGLSHPFDNHNLSMEGTFGIISEFPFSETVNGGYFAQSARILDAYIRLNNAVLRGGKIPDRQLSPVARRILEHIRLRGRPIHPWGGSDAHSHDFDRVVMAMDPAPGKRAADMLPQDMFKAMLTWEQTTAEDRQAPLPASPFTILGRAATPTKQVLDVAAIVMRNFYMNGLTMFNPLVGPRMIYATIRITQDELRLRVRAQKVRQRDLLRYFNPEALLKHVRMPDETLLVEPSAPPASFLKRSAASLRLVSVRS